MLLFQERLRDLREARGITQKRFADDMLCSRSLISAFENGTGTPNLEMLLKIADYFSVSTDYILGRAKNPNKVGETNSRYLVIPSDISDADYKLIKDFVVFISRRTS